MPAARRRTRLRALAAAGVFAVTAAAAATIGPAATPVTPAAPPARRLGPADLRDQFQTAAKALHKADNALGGHDAGRVSLLLQRADEEVVAFEDASGLNDFVREMTTARQAATADDLAGAERAVRRARAASASLTDYSVARSAEVAYRSALAASGDRNRTDFLAGLDAMEAAIRAPLLLDRLHAARAAITRARSAMVRSDFPGGRMQVAAARASLDALAYAGMLSRSCYAFLAASELLHDRATLTARDQLQKGLRDLVLAQEIAPPSDHEDLAAAHDQGVAIYKRMNKPEQGDTAALAAASARLEAVRQRQH